MQLTLENIAGRAGYSIGGVKQRLKDEERRMSTVMALPCIKAEEHERMENATRMLDRAERLVQNLKRKAD